MSPAWFLHNAPVIPCHKALSLVSHQVDIHMDGALVESLTEAGPNAPVLEAPPAGEDDAPDTGKCAEINISAVI